MMKKKKTGRVLLGFLLTLAMVIGLMPGMSMTVYAANPTVTISPAGGGTVSIETSGSGPSANYIFTATPADGYCFVKWTYNSFGSEANKTSNPMALGEYEVSQNYYTNFTAVFEPTTTPVSGISLDQSAVSLTVGGTETLTATVSPDGATDKKVKWSVDGTNPGAVKLYSNEACTVEVGADATETLTVYAKGNSAGSATVTVTSNADDTKSASCAVTVSEAAPSAYQLTLHAGENGKVVMSSGTYGSGSQGTSITANVDFTGNLTCSNDHFINVSESASLNILTGGVVSFYPTADNAGTITAVPADGYAFAGWYNGGTLYSNTAALSYQSISEELNLIATFEAATSQSSYNVTFKVVNGAWDEGDKADRTITLTGENVTLGAENIPHVGTKPDAGYKEGSWNVTPTPGTAITGDVTYTYTYVADSSGGSSDSGSGGSSGNSSSNDSNNDSSNNNNSSNDSGNSNSEPKDEPPYDYLDPLRGELKAEIALGGQRTVTWDQGTALPYDIMKTLQDNPGVTLIFSYTYQGIDYKVTISGRDAKAYTEIPWYGPLYLYKHYGSSSETAPANTTDTTTGERTYTVLPGDTLIGLAGKLNTTVDSLVSLNDIKNPDFILVGQILKY